MKELKYQKREKVEPKGDLEKVILFKPVKAPIVCLIAGVGLLIINNLLVRILGLFFILMSVLVIALVKDYKVMDIFNKGVMVYNDKDAEYCCFIDYEDIKTWDVKHENGQDKIIFEMEDGSIVERQTFQADNSRNTLMKYMKEKEIRYIKAKKSNENPLSIPDTFKVVKEKFLNKK